MNPEGWLCAEERGLWVHRIAVVIREEVSGPVICDFLAPLRVFDLSSDSLPEIADACTRPVLPS